MTGETCADCATTTWCTSTAFQCFAATGVRVGYSWVPGHHRESGHPGPCRNLGAQGRAGCHRPLPARAAAVDAFIAEMKTKLQESLQAPFADLRVAGQTIWSMASRHTIYASPPKSTCWAAPPMAQDPRHHRRTHSTPRFEASSRWCRSVPSAHRRQTVVPRRWASRNGGVHSSGATPVAGGAG
jgi:hypothetical protein